MAASVVSNTTYKASFCLRKIWIFHPFSTNCTNRYPHIICTSRLLLNYTHTRKDIFSLCILYHPTHLPVFFSTIATSSFFPFRFIPIHTSYQIRGSQLRTAFRTMLHISSLLATLLNFFPFTTAVDNTSQPALNKALKLAATNLDRHNILQSPGDSTWHFDFKAQPTYTFTPGSVVNANAATFPALTGIGMTVAMLNLGPCAMLPPHAHPRATNLVVAIVGNTTSWMVEENGVENIKVDLLPGILTIFPRGSLHAMQNNGMWTCAEH
jgi:hypothetical protein